MWQCAYTLRGDVLLKEQSGRIRKIGNGNAPAISPSGDKLAFLQAGNILLYSNADGMVKQVTRIQTSAPQRSFFPIKIAWHPGENYLLFTHIQAYLYDRRTQRLRRLDKWQKEAVGIASIWLVHLPSGHCRQVLSPFGQFDLLYKTFQLEASGVYEPLFSPDGQVIWFLHAGDLYEVGFDEPSGRVHAPKLVQRLGRGLDLQSIGACRAGSGALMLAWDAKRSRLVYWVGRFWGTGVSQYGYFPYQGGQLAKSRDWLPSFGGAIREVGMENIQGCSVDRAGHLWVSVIRDGSWQWTRADGRESLPVGAGRPSF